MRKKDVFQTHFDMSAAEFWAGHSVLPHIHPGNKTQLQGSC